MAGVDRQIAHSSKPFRSEFPLLLETLKVPHRVLTSRSVVDYHYAFFALCILSWWQDKFRVHNIWVLH